MSYSFQIKAASKAAALDAIATEVVKVIGQQPSHERDRFAIMLNAANVIAMLNDNDSKDVSVSCNGYLSTVDGEVTAASICCQASLVNRT